jgi:poly(beta-D-mannuronate) lyase
LSDMNTMNAKLAIPSRVGGIAVAYSQIRGFLSTPPKDRAMIEAWLSRRANETIDFFNNHAPTKASRNNLRAWASFAVGEIGIVTRTPSYATWALDSNAAMIMSADADGSLPLEMERKKYALHYQLHAISPLVTSIARLCVAGYGPPEADFTRLRTIANFSLNAAQNPDLVTEIAGEKQLVPAAETLKTTLAWLEPYIALTGDAIMPDNVRAVRPLTNSKLGGNMTLAYENQPINCQFRPELLVN